METNGKKDHLWIPDEEVIRVDKKPTGRSSQRDITFTKHGQKLTSSLKTIKETLEI